MDINVTYKTKETLKILLENLKDSFDSLEYSGRAEFKHKDCNEKQYGKAEELLLQDMASTTPKQNPVKVKLL